MTSDAPNRILGRLRSDDGTGVVRVEDRYDTHIDDLWSAITEPARLARWIAEVDGDLRLGGAFRARFTSGWEGTGTVVACEPPRRLLVHTAGDDGETVIEATLTADGEATILAIEERGLPVDELPAYGAGWQVHAEDLASYLAGGERCDMKARWGELIGAYRG